MAGGIKGYLLENENTLVRETQSWGESRENEKMKAPKTIRRRIRMTVSRPS